MSLILQLSDYILQTFNTNNRFKKQNCQFCNFLFQFTSYEGQSMEGKIDQPTFWLSRILQQYGTPLLENVENSLHGQPCRPYNRVGIDTYCVYLSTNYVKL